MSTTRIRIGIAVSIALLASGAIAAETMQKISPEMSFFVTSAGLGKGADLGGLAGADRHCQQ
ncbi:MAG: lectin, partial [Betaproteobacteria bacterium]|nr:lectin [Betaproteobacteria bacterium]